MPALQVKDFPPDLYEGLRDCAAQQDRSISQQTVRILREYLSAYRQVGGRAAWEVRAIERPAGEACCSPVAHPSYGRAEEERTRERIERRKRILEKINSLPKIEEPPGFSDPAELVRQMRDERDARLDFSFEPDAREGER